MRFYMWKWIGIAYFNSSAVLVGGAAEVERRFLEDRAEQHQQHHSHKQMSLQVSRVITKALFMKCVFIYMVHPPLE